MRSRLETKARMELVEIFKFLMVNQFIDAIYNDGH